MKEPESMGDVVRQIARALVHKECDEWRCLEWDKAGTYPKEVFDHIADLGWYGIGVPEEQGGSGGTDFPEVRQSNGAFRLLAGAPTGALSFQYPRNFVAPDGQVFGYDSVGKMYYVNPAGSGSQGKIVLQDKD